MRELVALVERRLGVAAALESWTDITPFDAALTADVAAAVGGEVPELPSGAGHDAGVLSLAGVPTAMLFVRNPTGVSHSPEEHAEESDAAGRDRRARPRSCGGWRRDHLLARARARRRVGAHGRARRGEGRRRSRRSSDGSAQPGDTVLPGLTLPGIANGHSHAFHRALRGRTHAQGGDFWAWREQMYAVAATLDAERYYALATAFFAEMLLAGYTAVGEFHYLHRDPTTVMADAVIAAARDAGIRLTLLDTLYRARRARRGRGAHRSERGAATVHQRPRDLAGASRVADVLGQPRAAEPPSTHCAPSTRTTWRESSRRPATSRCTPTSRSSRPRTRRSRPPSVARPSPCCATPARSARASPPCTPRTSRPTTSPTSRDRSSASARPPSATSATASARPARLHEAGATLTIGSDQHVVVDPFDELRALEGHERLATGRRGIFSPLELIAAATTDGYRSLGWTGGLTVGAVCDLVTAAAPTRRAPPGRRSTSSGWPHPPPMSRMSWSAATASSPRAPTAPATSAPPSPPRSEPCCHDLHPRHRDRRTRPPGSRSAPVRHDAAIVFDDGRSRLGRRRRRRARRRRA